MHLVEAPDPLRSSPQFEYFAPFFCPQTQPEFSDVPRLYEAMGEAEQVLKAIEEDREDGEDD